MKPVWLVKINRYRNSNKTFQNVNLASFYLCLFMNITAKFVVSLCTFCKLRRNFGFFCSVNHLSGPVREHEFKRSWFVSS